MDAFALLAMERRLILDVDELRGTFDRMVVENHPDAGGEEDGFACIRKAYETLLDPGSRLRHWLELGGVEWEAGGQVPAELMEMFGGVGDLVMRVDGLAARKEAAKSVLGRSLLEREGMGLIDEIEGMRERVGRMRGDAEGQFAGFEEAGATRCAAQASEVARTLMFLAKWDRQLRDRWAGLAW